MSTDGARLQHIINVLKVTPGCSSAGQSKYDGRDINRMDVHVEVEVDGRVKMIRRSGSAEFDSKVKMAEEVLRRVKEILGPDVVALAEEQMMAAGASASGTPAVAPPLDFSQEELEWLAEWIAPTTSFVGPPQDRICRKIPTPFI